MYWILKIRVGTSNLLLADFADQFLLVYRICVISVICENHFAYFNCICTKTGK